MNHLNLLICSEWVDVQILENFKYPLCPCEFPAGPGDLGATTDTLYRGGNCGSDGPTLCLRSQSLAPGPPLRLLGPNSSEDCMRQRREGAAVYRWKNLGDLTLKWV